MNSRLLLAIAGVVVVGGGIYAVRNLTKTDGVSDGTKQHERVADTSGGSSSGGSGIDQDDETRVRTLTGDNARDSRRPSGQRTFTRGEGAAALDVTPATTTALQAAAIPVVTPVTTTSEEMEEELREIADLASMFRNQTDPEARIDIADDLGMIDNPVSVRTMLKLLKEEQNPEVQAALLVGLQALDALEDTSGEVYAAITELYGTTKDPAVKIAAQDLLGDIATADASRSLNTFRLLSSDPAEKLNATENLLRIGASDSNIVSEQQVADMNTELKKSYSSMADKDMRSQAIMALAINGRDNLEFFKRISETEPDEQVRTLLKRFVQMFSAPTPTPTPQ